MHYMQVPSQVEYERATSVEHALSLLSRPDTRVVAGGHSLIPMMKLRLAQPEMLVDINGLAELAYIRLDGDQLRIGALARHADLLDSALAGEHFPIFHDAERVVADPIVRLWGTVGGSLCQADPSEDLSAVFAAARATAVIRGQDGDRMVPVREFHLGPYETVIGPRRAAGRGPGPGAAGHGQRVREGGAAGRRLVGRRRRGRAPSRRRGGNREPVIAVGRHRPDRGGRRALRGRRGRGVPASAGPPTKRASRRPGRSPPSTVSPSPTSADPRTTSGTWSPSSPPARCAGPPSGPPRARRAHAGARRDHAGRGDRERHRVRARRGAPAAAHPLPARRTRPDRQPLGLRHVELRQPAWCGWTPGRSSRARCSRRWRDGTFGTDCRGPGAGRQA